MKIIRRSKKPAFSQKDYNKIASKKGPYDYGNEKVKVDYFVTIAEKKD